MNIGVLLAYLDLYHNVGVVDVDSHTRNGAEYHAADLAGKPAVFKCLIHEIQVKELPALDDELIKDSTDFETVEEWKADGVVSITLHSCNPFAIETENIRRVCEKCGVPLLHIETDFGTADEGQIRTRIEAYLEMIRAKKEARNG